MINLINCQGIMRKVEEGIVYYPQDDCERDSSNYTSDQINLMDEVNKEMEVQGVQWGDAIAWVTHQFGITQCTPCKARQEILNKAGTIGVKETVKQIMGTFKKVK